MSQQKIAIVTGANRGLGRSEALALAADGVDVVVTYRSHEDEAASVVADIEALGQRGVALHLDASQPSSFAPFVDRRLRLLGLLVDEGGCRSTSATTSSGSAATRHRGGFSLAITSTPGSCGSSTAFTTPLR